MKKQAIMLTKCEIQSNLNRQQSAENLIRQLPATHEGRNTWLLNYGVKAEAVSRRKDKDLLFSETYQAAESRNEQLARQAKC